MNRSVKKVVWLFLILLVLVGATAGQAAESVLGQRFVLPNGLVCLFSQQSDLPLVTADLTVKAGALFDPPGKAGLANLTASLLRYGTRTRNAQQIAAEIDLLGAALSTSAGRDAATVKLTILKKDLRSGLEILQDVLLQPRFAPVELQAMVQRLQGTLHSQEDEPGIVAERAFRRTVFGGHPYGLPVIGTLASLPRISHRDVRNFHRSYYRPNNAILTMVGDLTLEEAKALAEEFFAAWEKGEEPPEPPAPVVKQTQPRLVKIDKDITQANIVVGTISLPRSDPDFYAWQLMNYILGGGGFTSRLMDNIRENRGLAYSVHSSFAPGLVAGPFYVSLETKNASGGEAVAEVLSELSRIRQELVTEAELAAAKTYLISSLPMKMDSNAKRAALLGYVEMYGLGLDYPWRYADIINAVTRDDILQVARKYLNPEGLVLVVVGRQQEINLNLPSTWRQETLTP
ncbi:MAG: M16 family metallopeptidase [Desulfobacca sp.]|uniref:M16 family metallopeptidase n=1 Tax=Desulfobacca sp. TaxID=2067990 RepID=UPI004049538C